MNQTELRCPRDGAPLICPACAGRKGGRARTARKLEAAKTSLERINESRWTDTAKAHALADAACNRQWQCTCGACRIVRAQQQKILEARQGAQGREQ